jgi:hypothetical protein
MIIFTISLDPVLAPLNQIISDPGGRSRLYYT